MASKILFFIFIFIFIAAFSAFFFHDSEKVFRCESEQFIDINTGSAVATMDAVVSIFIRPNETGSIKYAGYISTGDKNYELNRTIEIKYSKGDLNTFYKVTSDTETIGKNDTTPSDFFYSYFFPSPLTQDFTLNISILDKNAILVGGITHPFFVCAKKY